MLSQCDFLPYLHNRIVADGDEPAKLGKNNNYFPEICSRAADVVNNYCGEGDSWNGLGHSTIIPALAAGHNLPEDGANKNDQEAWHQRN